MISGRTFLHLCKMMISPGGFFFIFLKFSMLRLLGQKGQKGKKWPKMTKKSGALYISGIIYYMIGCYDKLEKKVQMREKMVQMRKKYVCRAPYLRKRAQNSLKRQKILSVVLDISETIHHMIIICGTQV